MENDDLPDDFDFADYDRGFLDGQIPFEFATPKHAIDFDAKLTPSSVQTILARLDRQAEKFRQDLENSGIRVFPVIRHNDTQSVEADYGAPVSGLAFVNDIFDPARSFRYDPVLTVEGEYKTHVPQAIEIGKALHRAGYDIFNGRDEETYPSHIHFANGGVTRAFKDITEHLIESYIAQNKIAAQYGYGQKAAFLVPVPTYGLFLHQLQQTFAGKDIDIVPVRRHDHGAVDQASLRYAIRLCREENKRIMGYYDCNPHNPTGYIREKMETEEIAGILQHEMHSILEQHLENMLSVFERLKLADKARDFPHNWLVSMELPQTGITLIDDMAYEGLEYSRKKKPYSFGQIPGLVAQSTAVMKSISKIGLPGARIGMIIAHPELIIPHAEKQLMTEFAASTFGVDILTARYGDESPHKEKFNAHIRKLSRQHNHRTGMVEAMFRGINNTDRLTAKEKSTLVRNYAAYSKIDVETSSARLSEGLAPFSLEENVESGFFHRINCDALEGHAIYAQFDTSPWAQLLDLSQGSELYWVFRSFGMKVVAGLQQGLSDRSMQVRITTSLPEAEMFRFYDSMRNMRGYFFGEKPQIQMDLFRKNYPQGLKYTP